MTYDPTFDAYDARRNRLEQIALARRQQERRAAEEAAWVQQQRRRAALEAAIEEEEERQHMIRQHELYRQRRAREIQLARERAAEEEYLRRKLAQRQHQMEIQRQQHEQERQQQQHLRQRVEQPQPQADIEVHPLESLLRAFFGQDSTSEKPAQENVKATSSPADQPQTQPTFEASTAPAAESDNSASAATAEDPAEQLFVHDTPNDADYESSSAEEEDAASTLQRHYRTHLHRRQALSTLSSLADSLKSQQASFILPETLTFQPSPASSTNDAADNEKIPAPTPRLAFSPSNAPLLAYEDFLVRLLSKIDAVSSGGDRTIKRARKELVKAVNDELSQLDEARDRAWKEQQERAAVLPTEPAAEKMNVEMTEGEPDLYRSCSETVTDLDPPPQLLSLSLTLSRKLLLHRQPKRQHPSRHRHPNYLRLNRSQYPPPNHLLHHLSTKKRTTGTTPTPHSLSTRLKSTRRSMTSSGKRGNWASKLKSWSEQK